MRIWIDGYEANVPQRLGSSQVAYELLRNLEEMDKVNEYTILLPSNPLDDLPKPRNKWKYKILKPRRLWTRIALPLALYTSRQKPDLIFSPTHYIPRFSPVKRIGMIFDLSFLHFPEMFNQKDLWQLKNWTKFSAENANHIVTISNFSKEDILKNYQIDKNKLTITYPGYDDEIFHPLIDRSEINKAIKKCGINGNYLIYIGTIQPRKNLVRLIEAITKIDNISLVVVGKTVGEGRSGWMYEEILKTPKELGIENRVIFTGFVPTEDLVLLLNGATAFILPSLWEGFGIPVVEAMACGIPVIVSNVSSLPEVVGKSGILIDPYSVDQIEQAVRTITTDKKLKDKYAKLSLEQAKKFSWKKMTKEMLKVFKEVADES